MAAERLLTLNEVEYQMQQNANEIRSTRREHKKRMRKWTAEDPNGEDELDIITQLEFNTEILLQKRRRLKMMKKTLQRMGTPKVVRKNQQRNMCCSIETGARKKAWHASALFMKHIVVLMANMKTLLHEYGHGTCFAY